jgi:hypothetical protein
MRKEIRRRKTKSPGTRRHRREMKGIPKVTIKGSSCMTATQQVKNKTKMIEKKGESP